MDKVQHELNKAFFFKGEYPLALKIVRGAYIVEERHIERAENTQLVWPVKAQTDACYNFHAEKLLRSLGQNSLLILATHNNESNMFLMDLVNGLENSDFLRQRIYFGTLLGLNDYFSFETLANGFNTVKVGRE